MIRKLMIVQWSGLVPEWTHKWLENTREITEAGHGWEFLLDNDLHSIRERICALGVKPPALEGRKLCDYRPALGEMYAPEIGSCEFWGHTDLDCVYGPLWEYVTDDLLAETDIFSNDRDPFICGPFSLWRTETASHVFRQTRDWRRVFESPRHFAWDERGIAPTLARSGLRMTHRHWEGEDSMYVHFTDTKLYPELVFA